MKKINPHNFSMSTKLILIYLIIVAIPILVMGIYFPVQLNREATDNMLASYHYSAERLGSELTAAIKDYLELPRSLTYDEGLVSFLSEEYKNDLQQYEGIIKTVMPIYEKLQFKNTGIRLRIVHRNKILDMSGMLQYDPEMEETGEMTFKCEIIGKTDYLAACIPVIDTREMKKPIGILKIYIPLRLIQDVLSSHGAVEHPVFLYDEQGNLITGTSKEDVRGDKAYREVGYRLDYPLLNIKGWRIVYLAPTYQLQNKLDHIYRQTYRLIVISVIISMAVILLFARSITQRINVLAYGMRELRQGDTRVQIPQDSSDEIGQLCGDFNVMVRRLDRLIQENYQSRIELQNAEIESQKLKNEQMKSSFLALQRQINPHYLFNTLESIRMKVLMGGDRETARIIEEFSDGYREMMNTSYEMITIEEELKLIQSFFTIIRFRFGEHIRLDISLQDQNLAKCRIFKFMIQPLIENAVYHGVERQDEDGRIELIIKREERHLVIEVRDNGVGMNRERIEEIMKSITDADESDNRNLALRNIYTRLRLVYKDDFSFEIKSRERCGTCVNLVIPLRR